MKIHPFQELLALNEEFGHADDLYLEIKNREEARKPWDFRHV